MTTSTSPAFLEGGKRSSSVVGFKLADDIMTNVVRRVLGALYDSPIHNFEHVKVIDALLLPRSVHYKGSDREFTEWAVVNSEGVGHERQANGNTILVSCTAGMGVVDVPVGIPVLLAAARVEESGPSFKPTDRTAPISLSDHIRSFGDRLERNFGIWHAWATVSELEF